MPSVNLNDDDYSLEVKDPWKRSRHLVTCTDLQFFEACVDILLLAASLPSQLKLTLLDCGDVLDLQSLPSLLVCLSQAP
jgi:hypothetical protein